MADGEGIKETITTTAPQPPSDSSDDEHKAIPGCLKLYKKSSSKRILEITEESNIVPIFKSVTPISNQFKKTFIYPSITHNTTTAGSPNPATFTPPTSNHTAQAITKSLNEHQHHNHVITAIGNTEVNHFNNKPRKLSVFVTRELTHEKKEEPVSPKEEAIPFLAQLKQPSLRNMAMKQPSLRNMKQPSIKNLKQASMRGGFSSSFSNLNLDESANMLSDDEDDNVEKHKHKKNIPAPMLASDAATASNASNKENTAQQQESTKNDTIATAVASSSSPNTSSEATTAATALNDEAKNAVPSPKSRFAAITNNRLMPNKKKRGTLTMRTLPQNMMSEMLEKFHDNFEIPTDEAEVETVLNEDLNKLSQISKVMDQKIAKIDADIQKKLELQREEEEKKHKLALQKGYGANIKAGLRKKDYNETFKVFAKGVIKSKQAKFPELVMTLMANKSQQASLNEKTWNKLQFETANSSTNLNPESNALLQKALEEKAVSYHSHENVLSAIKSPNSHNNNTQQQQHHYHHPHLKPKTSFDRLSESTTNVAEDKPTINQLLSLNSNNNLDVADDTDHEDNNNHHNNEGKRNRMLLQRPVTHPVDYQHSHHHQPHHYSHHHHHDVGSDNHHNHGIHSSNNHDNHGHGHHHAEHNEQHISSHYNSHGNDHVHNSNRHHHDNHQLLHTNSEHHHHQSQQQHRHSASHSTHHHHSSNSSSHQHNQYRSHHEHHHIHHDSSHSTHHHHNHNQHHGHSNNHHNSHHHHSGSHHHHHNNNHHNIVDYDHEAVLDDIIEKKFKWIQSNKGSEGARSSFGNSKNRRSMNKSKVSLKPLDTSTDSVKSTIVLTDDAPNFVINLSRRRLLNSPGTSDLPHKGGVINNNMNNGSRTTTPLKIVRGTTPLADSKTINNLSTREAMQKHEQQSHSKGHRHSVHSKHSNNNSGRRMSRGGGGGGGGNNTNRSNDEGYLSHDEHSASDNDDDDIIDSHSIISNYKGILYHDPCYPRTWSSEEAIRPKSKLASDRASSSLMPQDLCAGRTMNLYRPWTRSPSPSPTSAKLAISFANLMTKEQLLEANDNNNDVNNSINNRTSPLLYDSEGEGGGTINNVNNSEFLRFDSNINSNNEGDLMSTCSSLGEMHPLDDISIVTGYNNKNANTTNNNNSNSNSNKLPQLSPNKSNNSPSFQHKQQQQQQQHKKSRQQRDSLSISGGGDGGSVITAATGGGGGGGSASVMSRKSMQSTSSSHRMKLVINLVKVINSTDSSSDNNK